MIIRATCAGSNLVNSLLCFLSFVLVGQNLPERGPNADEGGVPGVQTAESQTAPAGSPPQQTGSRHVRKTRVKPSQHHFSQSGGKLVKLVFLTR